MATARAPGVKAGGEDRGIVAEEDITRSQKVRQVGKHMMGHRAGCTIDHEQSGAVTPPGGRLRDEVRRQRVVKKFGGKWCHNQAGRDLRLAPSAVASFFRSPQRCRASSVGRATLS